MKKFNIFTYLLAFFLPSFAFAFSLSGSNFKTVVLEIVDIINITVPILVATSFVVFFWGLSKFILHSDSKPDIEKGKNYMFWGVIALFVLASFRAIISLISTDLEFGNSTITPQLPEGASIEKPVDVA